MKKDNSQQNFWRGDFGKKYNDRCSFSVKEWDGDYKKIFPAKKLSFCQAV